MLRVDTWNRSVVVIVIYARTDRQVCVSGESETHSCGESLPEVAVRVNYPRPDRFDSLLLALHRLLATEHAKRELVDSGLQHGAQLPVHEACLVEALVVGCHLLDVLQLDESRVLIGGRALALRATSSAAARARLRRSILLWTSTAVADFFFGDEALLLVRFGVRSVAAGDRRQAPFKPPAVAVRLASERTERVWLASRGLRRD